MENPSASTLAMPSATITKGERPAPATPATMAKVVTAPSMAP
jgi:hypothetical protein